MTRKHGILFLPQALDENSSYFLLVAGSYELAVAFRCRRLTLHAEDNLLIAYTIQDNPFSVELPIHLDTGFSFHVLDYRKRAEESNQCLPASVPGVTS